MDHFLNHSEMMVMNWPYPRKEKLRRQWITPFIN